MMLCLILVPTACLGWNGSQDERFLTATYGTEVQATIENFKLRWLSLDSRKDPSVQAELATGPFLDYWGNARTGKAIYDEPFWLITTSAVVKYLRVLEYSPERFKAIARVSTLYDSITPEGKLIESKLPYEVCSVYVFIREGNAWKMATAFGMTVPQHVERD